MESREKPAKSILEDQGIKHQIEFRQIKAEDFPLIEELATIPKDLLIENFHNFFNNTREASANELQRQLANLDNPGNARLYEIMLYFAENYHWMSCYGLERALENLQQ